MNILDEISVKEIEFISANRKSPDFLILNNYSFAEFVEELGYDYVDFNMEYYKGLELCISSNTSADKIRLA